MVKVL